MDHKVKGVGFDMQAIDHILYTYAADHGPGPYVPRICEEYEKEFGHPAKDDFPEWEPCHDILLRNNVMGIENIGGDIEKVKGQRFMFCAFPLRWYMGDGTIVRAVAFLSGNEWLSCIGEGVRLLPLYVCWGYLKFEDVENTGSQRS